MKIALLHPLPFVLSAVGMMLSLTPAASAQTTGRSPVRPPVHALAFGFGGQFKSTDGARGTFKQTETVYNLNKSYSTTLVYTRSSDGATRTEKTDFITNSDGSHTQSFTLTDYGATASFTSTENLVKADRGQSVGQGTYLAADGTSGTLTTLETHSSGGVDVISTVYVDSTGGVSHEQSTQNAVAGKTVIKTVRVESDGTITDAVQTRTFTSLGNGLIFPGL